jgi:hypothetical protein
MAESGFTGATAVVPINSGGNFLAMKSSCRTTAADPLPLFEV